MLQDSLLNLQLHKLIPGTGRKGTKDFFFFFLLALLQTTIQMQMHFWELLCFCSLDLMGNTLGNLSLGSDEHSLKLLYSSTYKQCH